MHIQCINTTTISKLFIFTEELKILKKTKTLLKIGSVQPDLDQTLSTFS